ncbi:DUF3885 domain-containing protein [Aquibacillus rhizosphaerae]|uniref:DUF3885 domain-containing protein n=1 Tax=Aquibacillus rhizosphaerae TaxID=3051431 RepID=A0ABT7L0Y1_9BACI|nr:DUF3885 domain-containing protein [Aquibacillus sp. LR5S19]MDL4839447.1 DUF3885 domain-containing protein [Aquibacillus sp. LR5S19]
MNLYKQLTKEPSNWIRFELGLDKLEGIEYFNEMHYRAKSILNFLCNDSDTIWLIATVSNYKNSKGTDLPKIKRFLRNKKLTYNLKCKTVPYEYDEDDTGMETIHYSLKVNKKDMRLDYLIEAIGNKDFIRKPKINCNLSFVIETKGILFHMYDDRGCDVFSLKKDTLLPLYHKFRKWILDYNRIEIDRAFKEGLFNYYETTEEKEKRVKSNELKVKETEINLYQVNTCHITHALKIPNEFVQACTDEIGLTGFIVSVVVRNNDSTIVNATKTEALALIEYQTELMSLYSKKYRGNYKGWLAEKAY